MLTLYDLIDYQIRRGVRYCLNRDKYLSGVLVAFSDAWLPTIQGKNLLDIGASGSVIRALGRIGSASFADQLEGALIECEAECAPLRYQCIQALAALSNGAGSQALMRCLTRALDSNDHTLAYGIIQHVIVLEWNITSRFLDVVSGCHGRQFDDIKRLARFLGWAFGDSTDVPGSAHYNDLRLVHLLQSQHHRHLIPVVRSRGRVWDAVPHHDVMNLTWIGARSPDSLVIVSPGADPPQGEAIDWAVEPVGRALQSLALEWIGVATETTWPSQIEVSAEQSMQLARLYVKSSLGVEQERTMAAVRMSPDLSSMDHLSALARYRLGQCWLGLPKDDTVAQYPPIPANEAIWRAGSLKSQLYSRLAHRLGLRAIPDDILVLLRATCLFHMDLP